MIVVCPSVTEGQRKRFDLETQDTVSLAPDRKKLQLGNINILIRVEPHINSTAQGECDQYMSYIKIIVVCPSVRPSVCYGRSVETI